MSNKQLSKTVFQPSTLLLLLIAGLALWFILKGKNQLTLPAGKYLNSEEWDIKYDESGLPSKIIIHRDATRT